MCDRVGIIDRGRLIAEGTCRELVAQLEEHDRVSIKTAEVVEPDLEAVFLRLTGTALRDSSPPW